MRVSDYERYFDLSDDRRLWSIADMGDLFVRDIDKILREMAEDEQRKRKRQKQVPAHMRNQKCPCGSLRKCKNCQCELFKE
jgi:hypothetical protein|nr:MAG TPA: Preprotein translocase secA subunit, helicase, translocation, secretion, PROTEIN.18A [Caudoviricetes sp.]